MNSARKVVAFSIWLVGSQVHAFDNIRTLEPVNTFEIAMRADQRITDFIVTGSTLAFLVSDKDPRNTCFLIRSDLFGVEQIRVALPSRPEQPAAIRFDAATGFAVLYSSGGLVLLLNAAGGVTSQVSLPYTAVAIEFVGGSLVGANSDMVFPIAVPLLGSASPVHYGRGRVIEYLQTAPLSETSLAVADLVEGSVSFLDLRSGQVRTAVLHAPEIIRVPLTPGKPPILRPTLAASPGGKLFCNVNNFQLASGAVVLRVSADGTVEQSLHCLLPKFAGERRQFNPDGHMLPPYHLAVTNRNLYLANATRVVIYRLPQD